MPTNWTYVRLAASAFALEVSAGMLSALAARSERWSGVLDAQAGRWVDSSGQYAARATSALYATQSR